MPTLAPPLEEMMVIPPVPTLQTMMEMTSPMPLTPDLKGEEMLTRAMTLGGPEIVVSLVPSHAPTKEVILLNLPVKIPTHATTRTLDMVVSPVPSLATTLKVIPPMGEEIPTRATPAEGSDSSLDAAGAPITTNSLKPTNTTTNAGQNSPKTSIRPTNTNAAEMLSRPGMGLEISSDPEIGLKTPGGTGIGLETSTGPVPPPTQERAASPVRPSHCREPHVSPAPL